MPLDIALAWDQVNNRCDLVFNGKDFAVDTTFVTPVLMSLGCERRAHPDDFLPGGQPVAGAPLSNPKRGWAGDPLDPLGELTGSRQWTLARDKLGSEPSDPTVALALSIDQEALAWLSNRLGVALQITVKWLRRNTLGHQVVIGGQTIVVPQVVGQ